MSTIISQVIQSFFKSLFDNILDFIGQHSLYACIVNNWTV